MKTILCPIMLTGLLLVPQAQAQFRPVAAQTAPSAASPSGLGATFTPLPEAASIPEFTARQVAAAQQLISEKSASLPALSKGKIGAAVDYVMQASALKHLLMNQPIPPSEVIHNRFLSTDVNELMTTAFKSAFSTVAAETVVKALQERTKRIYGDDDRNDISIFQTLAQLGDNATQARSKALIDLSAAVCCMVHASNVHLDNTGGYLVQYSQTGLCASERYHSQPQLGFGTAFLVAPDIVATAAHCADESTDPSRLTFVFGFAEPTNGGWGQNMVGQFLRFPSTAVYHGKSVVKPGKNNPSDWALIKLDRPTGKTPVTKLLTRGITAADKVLVIGCPHGLPLKVADKGGISSIETDRTFHCNLDTYGGNSGSPVFVEGTFELAGILVSGGTDWRKVPQEGGCLVSVYAGEDDKGSEGVTQVQQFIPYLKP